MIYDLMVEIFKLCGGMLGYFKDHPETLGVIILLLRQHFIKKLFNRNLPKRFRDTHESDIQEIKMAVEDIKAHLGVESSNLQQNGSKATPILLYKRFFSLLQAITIPKRRVFKMSKWTSRKFLMAILAAILPIINEQFNMGLDTNVIIAAIGGLVAFILGESHIDAKRAEAGDVNLTADNTSNK